MAQFLSASLLVLFVSVHGIKAGVTHGSELAEIEDKIEELNNALTRQTTSNQQMMAHLPMVLEQITDLLQRLKNSAEESAVSTSDNARHENVQCSLVPDETTKSRLSELEQAVKELKQQNVANKPAVDDTWRDLVAQSACSGLQSSLGWMYAVRRDCHGGKTCAQICSDLLPTDSVLTSLTCEDSFHVYPGRHPLEKQLTPSDVEVLATKVYRYYSCGRTYCGPNFCCCRGLNH